MGSKPRLITEINKCRVCNSSLQKFLDLGKTPLADDFTETNNHALYPLQLGFCNSCGLVSLLHKVDPEIIFHPEYSFRTGASPSLLKHFRDYALVTEDWIKGSRLVVDIASNDGTLLNNYKMMGYDVLGVEPSTLAAYESKSIKTIVEFFSYEIAGYIDDVHGKAGLITANNVLAHVDDVHDFLEGVKFLLHPDGAFVCEVHHLLNLLYKNQFDNVYHEHLSFFSLHTLGNLLWNHDLIIREITPIDTQGGSIRLFITHANGDHYFPRNEGLRAVEHELGLTKWGALYENYQNRVEFIRKQLKQTLLDFTLHNKSIYGFGASAKSTTLLNFCEIGPSLVTKVVDKTPNKIGKVTPGTGIPIVAEKEGDYPDYYLLTVWNYLSDILRRERHFINQGGKFIVPMPVPFVI